MGIQVVKTLMADEEAKITKMEQELSLLTTNSIGSKIRISSKARYQIEQRVDFLARLIGESQAKIATFEAEETRLKKLIKLKE